jgi:cbb3-type cytochrome oxidase cytochrome c subunit
MTRGEMDRILPDGDEALKKESVPGYSAERLSTAAWDADERVLQGPIAKKDLTDKLEWYIGKKSIGRLGCYACHDLPGFEQAKPIGTALNDWGKKDPDRLAFEDVDAYVREHHRVVEARGDELDPARPHYDWRTENGKTPYEKFFFESLEHHQRDGFLHQKLEEPRSFYYHRERTWDDRLRMPQFRFARSKQRPGESDGDYDARQEKEEAEAREAVMTFVLGLVAEPVPLKHVNTPKPDRLAEVKGRQVLDKYNCAGCHLVRPGVYEFKPTPQSLTAMEDAARNAAGNVGKDLSFPGHNAWTGVASSREDRITLRGDEAKVNTEDFDRPLTTLRLADAVRFTGNDRMNRDITAGAQARFLPEDLIRGSEPLGGTFGELMMPYLRIKDNSTFKQDAEARAVVPPPLMREGERVQPKWLYQFLLNPKPVRPTDRMILRMPKFNMSPEEAQALVNYFGAVDKLGNPGAGITYPYLTVEQSDDKFWSERGVGYLERLAAVAKDKDNPDPDLDKRAATLLDQLVVAAKARLTAAEGAAKDAVGDVKAQLELDVKDLKASVDKLEKQVKDKDYASLKAQWKSPDAYSADAYRLIAANPNLCINCHSVGAMHSYSQKGPDLGLAAERLRPEWTYQWVANPERLFAHSPAMPQVFAKDAPDVQYQEYFAGDSRAKARAARDLLMDLPRLQDLPANRQTRAAVAGGGK